MGLEETLGGGASGDGWAVANGGPVRLGSGGPGVLGSSVAWAGACKRIIGRTWKELGFGVSGFVGGVVNGSFVELCGDLVDGSWEV